MPTKRFHNLPDDKKERITQSIIHEFSVKGIDETDVADIVRKAEIPRGSFYQYFEDKDDAIMHIINRIKEDKLAYLSGIFESAENMPFIDFYEKSFMRGLEFAADHPAYIPIGAYIMTSKNKKIKEYLDKSRESFYPFFELLINKDKEKGLIKKDIDNKAILLLVITSTSDIAVKMVFEQHSDFDDVRMVFQEIFQVIRRGLSSGSV